MLWVVLGKVFTRSYETKCSIDDSTESVFRDFRKEARPGVTVAAVGGMAP